MTTQSWTLCLRTLSLILVLGCGDALAQEPTEPADTEAPEGLPTDNTAPALAPLDPATRASLEEEIEAWELAVRVGIGFQILPFLGIALDGVLAATQQWYYMQPGGNAGSILALIYTPFGIRGWKARGLRLALEQYDAGEDFLPAYWRMRHRSIATGFFQAAGVCAIGSGIGFALTAAGFGYNAYPPGLLATAITFLAMGDIFWRTSKKLPGKFRIEDHGWAVSPQIGLGRDGATVGFAFVW